MAALLGAAAPAVAQESGAADAEPSLEYRPPRVVVPEPKGPTPAPPVSMFRQSFGGFGIGVGSFDGPIDVALDESDNIYVLDVGNNRVQKFDSFLRFVREWGSPGTRNGEFDGPSAIAVGPGGFVYVVDTGNNRVQQFSQNGEFLMSWGSLGSRSGAPGRSFDVADADGLRDISHFKAPRDITFADKGAIWVLDAGNERVQQFVFRPRASGGGTLEYRSEFGRAFGSRGGLFNDLVSIAWSEERFGYIYLLGPGCLVQQFKTDGTFESNWPAVAPESELCVPARLEVDDVARYLYVLDSGNGLLARFHREGRFLSAVQQAERAFLRPGGFALKKGQDEYVVADTGNNLVQKYTLR